MNNIHPGTRQSGSVEQQNGYRIKELEEEEKTEDKETT